MLQNNTACQIAEGIDIASLTDKELVEQISKCSTPPNKALDELANRHYTWVYRICLMRLGNPSDAEDIAQEVFVRVQKHIQQFENRSTVRTWMYRIAQNQCNTFISNNIRVVIESIEDYTEILKDIKVEVSNSKSELSEQINYALSMLPKQCRAVIDMRFFQELSLQEISNHLNIGLSAAKMRLYRAQNKFKLIYAEGSNI